MYAFRIKAGYNPQALHRRLSFKNVNAAMRPKGHIGLNETGFQTTLTIPATFATEPSDVDATAVTPGRRMYLLHCTVTYRVDCR